MGDFNFSWAWDIIAVSTQSPLELGEPPVEEETEDATSTD
jgi:hypothetical protein